MKVIIGSHNKAKIKAVRRAFKDHLIYRVDSPSNVSKQPTTDEETLSGAMNRTLYCHNQYPNDISIGLEGGVMLINGDLYLCNWGVLMSPLTKTITASGARIKLPQSFKSDLFAGVELSELIDAYSNKHDTRQSEGAIGIFTEGIIDRIAMFEHVALLLKGQYEHALKVKSS